MLPESEWQVRSTDNANKPATADGHIDNEVLLTVQREYSMMDQEHARIRAEALASSPEQR
ncbi:MAG TPA: hypothetical protein VJS64_00395 [Pyrinomonadaceae bacterium]|nr:hypothetical protein [Pyrinomonadaceae bacterium]